MLMNVAKKLPDRLAFLFLALAVVGKSTQWLFSYANTGLRPCSAMEMLEKLGPCLTELSCLLRKKQFSHTVGRGRVLSEERHCLLPVTYSF